MTDPMPMTDARMHNIESNANDGVVRADDTYELIAELRRVRNLVREAHEGADQAYARDASSATGEEIHEMIGARNALEELRAKVCGKGER